MCCRVDYWNVKLVTINLIRASSSTNNLLFTGPCATDWHIALVNQDWTHLELALYKILRLENISVICAEFELVYSCLLHVSS